MSAGGSGDPRRLEGHVESLRHDLGELISELDRRRHEAFDVRLQVKRHPLVVAVAGVAAATLVGVTIGFMVHRRHEREKPMNRARRARRAVQRLMDDPEHMARESTVGEKILATAGSVLVTMLIHRVVERVMPDLPD